MSAAFMLPLAISALLLIVMGTVIGLSRFYFVGTNKFTYKTLQPGLGHGPRWYASLNRAYINGIESFALTAPGVLLHHMLNSPHLAMVTNLVWLYLIGRVLYNLVYISKGYHFFVSVCWLIAFAGTIGAWVFLLV
jgi:uncharacterized MAPEG superfamily protein